MADNLLAHVTGTLTASCTQHSVPLHSIQLYSHEIKRLVEVTDSARGGVRNDASFVLESSSQSCDMVMSQQTHLRNCTAFE